MSTPTADVKRCSVCGTAFECGARSQSCWCQQLPALPADLLQPETDCLCPRCLAARTAEAAITRPGETVP